MRPRFFAALAAVLLAIPAATAPGNAANPDPVGDARLIAAARSEGAVSLYTSVSLEDTTKLAQRFEAQYAIPVRVLRMESNQLPARLVLEARAGRANADAVLSPTLQMYALKSAGMLALRPVPEERDYLAATVDRDGAFGGVLINTDTIAYNPALLAAAHLAPPRQWADLTRPEWRGKFALYDHSYEWYLAMKRVMGAVQAEALMRGLAANAPNLVASHQLAINAIADGEHAAAANVFGYDAVRLQAQGRPIAFVAPAPTIAEVNAIGITQHAAHPSAALLFERWALSRATQRYITDVLGRSSGRKDIVQNPAVWNVTMRITISDPSNADDYRAAASEFDAFFKRGG